MLGQPIPPIKICNISITPETFLLFPSRQFLPPLGNYCSDFCDHRLCHNLVIHSFV